MHPRTDTDRRRRRKLIDPNDPYRADPNPRRAGLTPERRWELAERAADLLAAGVPHADMRAFVERHVGPEAEPGDATVVACEYAYWALAGRLARRRDAA